MTPSLFNAVRIPSPPQNDRCSNAVLFSNRSAAHAGARRWAEARADGEQAVKLRPDWGKAHSRLAAALVGLGLFPEAVAAAERRALASFLL